MANGEYKLIKMNSGSSFDEKTILAVNGSVLGFNASLDPVMLNLSSWAQAASKPTYAFSEITSKPTTLAGYGITDAYTHPTTSGNKHIPSGGSSGQILRWSADGTAAWGADNNSTYSAATGTELNTGTDTTKFATAKALADSKYRLFEVGSTAPASPAVGTLWIDTSSAGFTDSDIANWNTAFGWGNHASQGYLKTFTESDPYGISSIAFSGTSTKTITVTLRNSTTKTANFTDIGFDDPTNSAGDLMYRNSSNARTRLPVSTTIGHVLTVTAAGTVNWAAPPATGISGSGTAGRLPYFNTGSSVASTSLYYNSTNGWLGIGASPSMALYVNGSIGLANGGTIFLPEDGEINFNGDNKIYPGDGDLLVLECASSGITFKLNGNTGLSGQVLVANGAGVAVWQDPPSGGASALADLTDATVTSPADSQILGYSSGKWRNLSAQSLGLSPVSHHHNESYVALSGNQTVGGVKIFSSNLGVGDTTSSVFGSNSTALVVKSTGSATVGEILARSTAGGLATLYADASANCHVGAMNPGGKLYLKANNTDVIELGTSGSVRFVQYGAGYLKTDSAGTISLGVDFWEGTGIQYAGISTKNSNTIYFVTD